MDLTAFARAIPSPKDFLLTQTIFPTVEMREVPVRQRRQVPGVQRLGVVRDP